MFMEEDLPFAQSILHSPVIQRDQQLELPAFPVGSCHFITDSQDKVREKMGTVEFCILEWKYWSLQLLQILLGWNS